MHRDYFKINLEVIFMKKRSFLAFALILAVMLSIGIGIGTGVFGVSASAVRIGDEIGDVLNTDIRTYIDGHRIPSYNINNRSVVLMSDLIYYGFDSHWDPVARITTLTRNPDKRITPLTEFDEQLGRPGTVAFRHLHTDIVAIINGVAVPSYNIRGNTAVLFGDLSPFGTHRWNNDTRASTLTLHVPVTGVTLDRTSASMRVNESITLRATVSPGTATNRNITWTSSNPNVARVNTGGLVAAVAPGTAVITATSHNGRTATATITVQPAGIAVTSVRLDISNATSNVMVRVGDTRSINAVIQPNNATERTLQWSSSNNSIATVDNQGRVTGHRAGNATITAAAPSGVTGSITVRVENIVAASSVTIAPAGTTTMGLGAANVRTFTATVLPNNATYRNVDWTSSNTNVATVDNQGRVTGHQIGTATITATTHNGRTASVTVNVVNLIPASSVTIAPASPTVAVTATTQLTATVLPANATNRTVTWSSNNPSVATVTEQGGVVTGVALGTAVITATTHNNISQSVIITVGATRLTDFELNREFGPFRFPAQGGGVTQINSLRFAARETVDTVYDRITISMHGTSPSNIVSFIFEFRDENNSPLGELGFAEVVSLNTADQSFQGTATINVRRDIIDRTVRIALIDLNRHPVEFLHGSTITYWTGAVSYTRFQTVTNFATIAASWMPSNQRLFARMTIHSDTSAVFTYNFAHHPGVNIESILSSYRTQLMSRGFTTTSTAVADWMIFTQGNTTVSVNRSGNTVMVQITSWD